MSFCLSSKIFLSFCLSVFPPRCLILWGLAAGPPVRFLLTRCLSPSVHIPLGLGLILRLTSRGKPKLCPGGQAELEDTGRCEQRAARMIGRPEARHSTLHKERTSPAGEGTESGGQRARGYSAMDKAPRGGQNGRLVSAARKPPGTRPNGSGEL